VQHRPCAAIPRINYRNAVGRRLRGIANAEFITANFAVACKANPKLPLDQAATGYFFRADVKLDSHQRARHNNAVGKRDGCAGWGTLAEW
jgi:hypothetical protein